LRLLAATTQFDGLRPDDGARALVLLGARARNLEQAIDVLLAQHSLAVNRGRPSEALTVTRRMQSLSPATRLHLRLRVLDAVFAEGDSAAARAAVRELERSAAQRGQTSGPTACALAQWHFAHRDSVGVRSALAVLRDSAAKNDRSAADYACRELVAAQLIVLTNSPDARATVARVDSLQLNGPAVGDIATFANLALARLYRELGEPQLALSALRRQPYVRAAWPRYRATAWREESELAMQTGDHASARSAVEHYLRMRSGAEPRVAATLGTFRDSLASWSKRSAGSRTNE
jgi:hypothetical protein